MDNPQWIMISDRLPQEGQKVLIMWRYKEGFVWRDEITRYIPFGRTGKPRKYPFGKTYEVQAWFPLPECLPSGYEILDKLDKETKDMIIGIYNG